MLLHIYNRIWKGDDLPTMWKTAVIKPLLKDGKVIAERLTYILESKGLLTNNQAGFRQNRCTTDQVLTFIQNVTNQIHRKGGESSTFTTFFDHEKAYDKV